MECFLCVQHIYCAMSTESMVDGFAVDGLLAFAKSTMKGKIKWNENTRNGLIHFKLNGNECSSKLISELLPSHVEMGVVCCG